MNVEPLRRSVLAAVAAEIEAERAQARAERDAHLAEARARADALVAEARRRAEEEAEAVVAERLMRARRDGRSLVLAAQAAAFERFRREAVRAVLALRASPGYPGLLERLAEDARALLGPGAELELDPPGVGGVVGRASGRQVDYTLPALVDRCIAELGDDITGLWT